jgi:hypothetical protein
MIATSTVGVAIGAALVLALGIFGSGSPRTTPSTLSPSTLASTGSPPTSPIAFGSDLTAICAQARESTQSLGQPTAADLGSWTDRAVALAATLTRKDAALQPPANVAAPYRTYIAGLESSLARLRQIAAAVKTGNRAELSSLTEETASAATRKGNQAASTNGWGCSLTVQPTTPQTADAAAEELAHTAQVAIETLATDHNGSYASANGKPSALQALEATIQIRPGNGNAYISSLTSTANSYTVTANSTTGDTFSINRLSTGSLSNTCSPTHGTHGNCVNGAW